MGAHRRGMYGKWRVKMWIIASDVGRGFIESLMDLVAQFIVPLRRNG